MKITSKKNLLKIPSNLDISYYKVVKYLTHKLRPKKERQRHCFGCSILLKELNSKGKMYKHGLGVSPVDMRFCVDCESGEHLKGAIHEFCPCGAKITDIEDEEKRLNYFLKKGNYCKACLKKSLRSYQKRFKSGVTQKTTVRKRRAKRTTN